MRTPTYHSCTISLQPIEMNARVRVYVCTDIARHADVAVNPCKQQQSLRANIHARTVRASFVKFTAKRSPENSDIHTALGAGAAPMCTSARLCIGLHSRLLGTGVVEAHRAKGIWPIQCQGCFAGWATRWASAGWVFFFLLQFVCLADAMSWVGVSIDTSIYTHAWGRDEDDFRLSAVLCGLVFTNNRDHRRFGNAIICWANPSAIDSF